MLIELNETFLRKEMEKVNPDPASFLIFEEKSNIIPIKFLKILSPGVNILKQEMLSLGGDAVVHRNAVDCKVIESDVILLGTRKHYKILSQKLKTMPYFGLALVGEELDDYLKKKKISFIKSQWGRELIFNKTLTMGVINITPNSFFPLSRKESVSEALKTATEMIKSGVDIIDVGGLSTRPGSLSVSLEEEMKRILPVIKSIRRSFPQVPISVDTYRSEVAKRALDIGVDIVNDISGLSFDKDLTKVISDTKAPLILMHIKGTPENMQKNPHYKDVVKEIIEYFQHKISYAVSKGIEENKIIIDPGIGFGKRYQDNLEIFAKLESLKTLHHPILVGASRKGFIGTALNDIPVEDRLEGTLAITSLCVIKGVDIVRVHDVKENVRIIKMLEAIKCQNVISPSEAT